LTGNRGNQICNNENFKQTKQEYENQKSSRTLSQCRNATRIHRAKLHTSKDTIMKAVILRDSFAREAALRQTEDAAMAIIGDGINNGAAKLVVHFPLESELPLPIALAEPSSVVMPVSFRFFGINE
jgi:hypothetical protein